jgi:phenolic acid decarboxylase
MQVIPIEATIKLIEHVGEDNEEVISSPPLPAS